MPIPLSEARQIAETRLRAIEAMLAAAHGPGTGAEAIRLKLIEDATESTAYDWVFHYNSRAFLVDGIKSARLAGNAPLVVCKADGRITARGTPPPLRLPSRKA